MARKVISLSLGSVFVWSLIISAWGYCPPSDLLAARLTDGQGQAGAASGPQTFKPALSHELEFTSNHQIKEAHHPCHSLKNPYVATIVRDFLKTVSPDSTLKDISHPEILFLDKELSHSSGSLPPPINAPPLNSQPLFLLNQSLLI